MIMQDRAKRTMFYHDLDKDAKINHVLDKGSIVANPFFIAPVLLHSRTSVISSRYLNKWGISKINWSKSNHWSPDYDLRALTTMLPSCWSNLTFYLLLILPIACQQCRF